MENEFLYGCAYYPEYMPYERIDEDFALMQKAGMNVVRIAESTWSTLEPKEGEYDFYHIDEVLKRAEKYGLKVIIGTPTYAIPSWLAKLDENVLVHTKNGEMKYGKRQIFNLLSDTYIFYGSRIIRKLLEHTANHPQVIGFQIDNETKHYDNFGAEIQEAFIRLLKSRYTDIEEFNKDFGLAYWSNSIHSWEDFPDISGTINASLACEFEEFQRDMAVNFLKMQAEIVNEYKKPEQFITHNFDFEWRKFGADIAQDGYSYGVQDGINHLRAADALTHAGTDIYHPTGFQLTGAEIAFCGDEIRSLKNDNYFVLECQSQAFKYWCPFPKQLRLHAFSHIASGADGVMYWNWHSIHQSFETYWKGILSHDLKPSRVYNEISEIGNEIKALTKEKLCIKKKNRIALLVDTLSLNALKWFPIDKKLSYNDVVRYMYDSLYEENLECDVIFSEYANIDKYEAIICPALYCVSEELTKKLDDFVKRGGILIGGFRSFVADRRVSVYTKTLPAGLTDCFGVHYDEFTHTLNMGAGGKEVKYVAELVTTDTAKEIHLYEHIYWNNYSAVTCNEYGRGKAYYIASYLDKTVLKDVLREALKAVYERQNLPVQTIFPVITRRGVNELNEELTYVFNYSCKPVEVEICVEAEKGYTDAITGKSYVKGDKLRLEDWGVVVLVG